MVVAVGPEETPGLAPGFLAGRVCDNLDIRRAEHHHRIQRNDAPGQTIDRVVITATRTDTPQTIPDLKGFRL